MTANTPPFHYTVRRVLEGAIDCNDVMVINACRRLIWAFTLGFKKHAQAADIALVRAFEI